MYKDPEAPDDNIPSLEAGRVEVAAPENLYPPPEGQVVQLVRHLSRGGEAHFIILHTNSRQIYGDEPGVAKVVN